MNKVLYFILTVLVTSVILSSCNTEKPSNTTDTSDATIETLDTADTPVDVFSEDEYKNYTLGVKVDPTDNKEAFSAQMSGKDNSVYVSFTPILYNSETYQYEQGERVYYRFNSWRFDEAADEKVYFEGNKTLDAITSQAMMSAVFKSANSVTRPENYGYVRDTLAPLTFTETSRQAHATGNNAVHLTILTWDGDNIVQSMRYTVNYATRKVDLVKTDGDVITYYTSEEQISEEAVAYFLLLAADMDYGTSELYASDINTRLGNTAVYKGTSVNYEDIKSDLHSVIFNESQKIHFPTVTNNVTDFDTYTDSEAIYFPLGDTFYYMLTLDGSLYEVIGIRTCTPYITPDMTHMSSIHAPIVRKAEGTYDYEAVKALLTKVAQERS